MMKSKKLQRIREKKGKYTTYLAGCFLLCNNNRQSLLVAVAYVALIP